MLQVCSLHQAETAAAQRIQELDSYLREVRSCGTRSAIVAVPGTFIKGLRPLPPTPGHWRVMPASVYIQHHILSSHIFWASWQLKECINTCQ